MPRFSLGDQAEPMAQLFYFLGENMELKRPTLIEEQIDTLVSHGVLIADREGIGIKDARGSDSTGIVCCLCWINTCHLEP